jgi:hypothetical protein
MSHSKPVYTPIDLDAVRVAEIPTRGYDFNRGDRRFFDRSRALEHANHEAILTGIRQVVRVTAPPILGGTDVLHLVQAVGS